MKKKSTLSIVLLVALVVVAVVTCPDEQAHKRTIASALNGAVNEKIDQKVAGEDYGIIASMVGGALSKYAVDFVVESKVRVENHFVCSIGRMTWKGEEKVCSIGCFGHVFCPSKEKMLEAMSQE